MSTSPEPGGLPAPAAARPEGATRSRGLPAHLASRLQESLLPARRMLSRAALVYEERHFREVAVNGVAAALSAEAHKIRDEMRSLEERIILRVDIVMEELWRRTEGVGARQATELQRLAARLDDARQASAAQAPELARLATQMAEVHRLATDVAEIRRATGDPAAAGGERSPLLAELERGLSIPPARRFEPYLKYFENLAPVVDLSCGQGDFLRLAAARGVEAYGLAPDPGGPGLDGLAIRPGSALEHLQALDPGSLGGIFGSHAVDDCSDEEAIGLLRAMGSALKPGGLAIAEAANPASFARFLTTLSGARPAHPRTPEHLAELAGAAGLDVDECRYGAAPDRHLAGVSQDLSDPALAEIAEGINALVSQLNDVLYGPQDYALILRAPGPA